MHLYRLSIYNGRMRKRFVVFLLVLVVALGALSAAPFRFVFGDLGQHPEIVMGFLPSYFMGGAGYSGITLLEGNKTEIQLLAAAGYNQRKLWQDPWSGSVVYEDAMVYDVADFDWSLRLAQGFGDSKAGNKDLVTLTLSYDGQYEVAVDSLALGKVRKNGGQFFVDTVSGYLGTDDYDGTIYPELNGSRQFLGTQFSLSFKYDQMTDTIHTNDGTLIKGALKWGPAALNKALDGYASYYSASMDIINAKTLYELKKNGDTFLSIVFIDRVNASFVDGDAIPAFIQGPNSLGRKVRGFNTYTYNTTFTMVNNADIRFAGPFVGIDGIAPRVNLFFDCGFGYGRISNTEFKETNVLSSFGIQAAATFFDFCDLGYQLAYLIKGNNYVHTEASRIVGSVTFFLDF